jgi:ATP-dependent phosphofructokinase / diphosphate-dependent phosphofructokinase
MAKRIGILTGGGDVPGLNSVIKEVVYRGTENHYDVIGLRRGWEGLTHVNLDDPASREQYVQTLDRANTRTIDRYGGTILHSSRTNPARVKQLPSFLAPENFPQSGATWDLTSHVLANLDKLGIDHLVVIGGDDTLGYASKLDKLGVKVVAIPKTMDNDVRNTEYCVGFSTAITRATGAIQRQRTTVGSHERVGIFRVFGRDAGFTSLYTAYTTSIRCCIPEYEVNLAKLIDLLLVEKRNTPSNYVLVVLSEGSHWQGYQVMEYGEPDAYGHRRKASVAEALSNEISRRAGEESIVSDLTYDLRSGEPDFVDKMIAATFGNLAMDAVLAGRTGVMASILEGCYTLAPIPDPALGPRKIDVPAMYNTDRYRPKYSDKLGMPVFLTRAV